MNQANRCCVECGLSTSGGTWTRRGAETVRYWHSECMGRSNDRNTARGALGAFLARGGKTISELLSEFDSSDAAQATRCLQKSDG